MSDRERQRARYEREVLLLLAEYGLKFGPITAPPIPFESIAEQLLGLRCEIADIAAVFGNGAVAAVLPEEKLILIDAKGRSSSMYGFTFCHELGHYLLHPRLGRSVRQRQTLSSSSKFYGDRVTLQERQADRFAAALLMPAGLLREFASRYDLNQSSSISELARLFSASPQAMKLRLQELGLLEVPEDPSTRC